MIREQRGFSLVELIIVMGIFMIIIMVTTQSFETIVTQASQQGKSAQTQIEGIVGLEVLRADLEQAGFGLPWLFSSALTGTAYTEVNVGTNEPVAFPSTIASAEFFNDTSPISPPRAILNGSTMFNYDTSINKGSQYLVLKSSVAGIDPVAKKWTSVAYTEAGPATTTWGQADRDLGDNDRIIVIKTTFANNLPKQQLMVKGGQFSTIFSEYSSMSTPHTPGDIFHIYGVDKPDGAALRMPFNRADYYIKRPATMPATCAPNTGILYKAVANHADGSLTPELPLLDCVADMQVVYGLDAAGNGFIGDHVDEPPAKLAQHADQAETIRSIVKEVRVYILAQEGKRDRTYNFPSSTIRVGESFGGNTRGRDFDLEAIIGADYKHYRWKVYTIVVRPKNLIQ
ncbi:prepilin-type N-terminal cleavage/methylation domain-containing protein [Geomobilimonas luticola]|uniref:Prepilin-type N-terminal cleavage/methylation domain-containing protein n=1 Tax=Geomobilimonas luticola TaxID=1114878 RepID=A0ABS5SBR9_9BACT|nr:PilW family protein [Geomobilimonas luticola]MBT0652825.1 prepilin-type N-terminal cleavage/methylation domain-containing protein [Geomobilimonas luticola]